jgi:hypothetical protein
MSPPGIEPGLRPSQSRVRSGTLRGLSLFRIPRRGVEPHPTASNTAMLPSHSRGVAFKKSNSNIPTWSRTRTWSFGDSNAILYTIGTTAKHIDARLPPHPRPEGEGDRVIRGRKKQARARGVEPRGAVLEAACSPGSTLVKGPRTAVRGLKGTQLSSGTFQYASLMNFDQLSMRTLLRA